MNEEVALRKDKIGVVKTLSADNGLCEINNPEIIMSKPQD